MKKYRSLHTHVPCICPIGFSVLTMFFGLISCMPVCQGHPDYISFPPRTFNMFNKMKHLSSISLPVFTRYPVCIGGCINKQFLLERPIGEHLNAHSDFCVFWREPCHLTCIHTIVSWSPWVHDSVAPDKRHCQR